MLSYEDYNTFRASSGVAGCMIARYTRILLTQPCTCNGINFVLIAEVL